MEGREVGGRDDYEEICVFFALSFGSIPFGLRRFESWSGHNGNEKVLFGISLGVRQPNCVLLATLCVLIDSDLPLIGTSLRFGRLGRPFGSTALGH